MASPARFERAAFRLGGERSILLSYGETVCASVGWENAGFRQAYALLKERNRMQEAELRLPDGTLIIMTYSPPPVKPRAGVPENFGGESDSKCACS